jgi:hypothetical protein
MPLETALKRYAIPEIACSSLHWLSRTAAVAVCSTIRAAKSSRYSFMSIVHIKR